MALFAALLIAAHLPYLRLPFHWDEAGQFVPASLDLYRTGSWIPYSTVPNVHPPGVMALLALVWKIFGYSIISGRLTMLAVASLGVLFSFLLAIRLARGAPGAPAFAAALFLMAAPIFYTQSMSVLLDMPAMTLTILALLLFLEERYVWCAAVCTLLVLTKETAITTPAVFACWLLFREKKIREGFYFAAPAVALGLWLVVLHRATGNWLGNREFAEYNVTAALEPFHIGFALIERIWFLFVADGHFLGTIALYAGWRWLRRKDWAIAVLVGGAQVLIVTVLGGAELERYLLPALPILYAAFAVAASAYPARWRWVSHGALLAFLIAGWFWNSPFPLAYEDNLEMIDFVHLQQEVSRYLETAMPSQRVASAWPLSDEIQYPDLGYVTRPLRALKIPGGLKPSDLAALNRRDYDVLVMYSNVRAVEGSLLDVAPLRGFLKHYYYGNYHPQATAAEIRAINGFVPIERWTERHQWVEVYVPGPDVPGPDAPAAR